MRFKDGEGSRLRTCLGEWQNVAERPETGFWRMGCPPFDQTISRYINDLQIDAKVSPQKGPQFPRKLPIRLTEAGPVWRPQSA
jgi:hypothetical protein